jgi:hypothetical protein
VKLGATSLGSRLFLRRCSEATPLTGSPRKMERPFIETRMRNPTSDRREMGESPGPLPFSGLTRPPFFSRAQQDSAVPREETALKWTRSSPEANLWTDCRRDHDRYVRQ